jgi:hypothetical protein
MFESNEHMACTSAVEHDQLACYSALPATSIRHQRPQLADSGKGGYNGTSMEAGYGQHPRYSDERAAQVIAGLCRRGGQFEELMAAGSGKAAVPNLWRMHLPPHITSIYQGGDE